MLVVVAIFAPLIFNTYWVARCSPMLILGILAATLIFLSAYGGMVSLAQVALYGIAGFAIGNLTTNGNTKGLNLAWAPLARDLGRAGRTGWSALVFGVLARRSFGIYFLMITLTFSVIANLFFGQVTTLSGFGGISGIPTPAVLGDPTRTRTRLYYVALVARAARLRPAALPRAHAVRADPAGHPRRPGADELARLQGRSAPRAGVRS